LTSQKVVLLTSIEILDEITKNFPFKLKDASFKASTSDNIITLKFEGLFFEKKLSFDESVSFDWDYQRVIMTLGEKMWIRIEEHFSQNNY